MQQSIPEVARKLALEFIDFVNVAVSPFHVVEVLSKQLVGGGFKELRENDNWDLQVGGKYYFTRNLTTLVAFTVGDQFHPDSTGFKVIGAHTDSPCLRLAPISKLTQVGIHQTCVTTYGGGLWHTWFDRYQSYLKIRELTIAGRIIYKNGNVLQEKLYHHPHPLLKIPNLAIHLLSADERGKFAPNTETHLRPVLASQVYADLTGVKDDQGAPVKHYAQLYALIERETGISAKDIQDLDFYLTDTQPAQLFGLQGEFLSSPRLDNLVSSYFALKAILSDRASGQGSQFVNVVTLFDHEEIGSQSAQGADSTLLSLTLERIHTLLSKGQAKPDSLHKALHRSFIISADMAHGIHPNYQEKHHTNHKVKLNEGVVFKYNYNQRYATDGVSASLLRSVADIASVPVQEFIVKNDSPCGSTIGPISASLSSIKTIDIGIPQWGMHSIRETAGIIDLYHYHNLFQEFYASFDKLSHQLLGL